MTDNTTLNPGSSGDTIRDIDRGTGSKTQVVQLDLGGAKTNAENLITAGQQTSANSVPVVLASDQPAINVNAGQYDRLNTWVDLKALVLAAANANQGFVPLEIPEFLVGL